MSKQKIPASPSIKRLPSYLHIIRQAASEGYDFISGTLIATELNLEPIQVRKDLAAVSKEDGKPGVGFEIDKLIEDINEFLDLNQTKNVIIVGAGRLGQALLNYNQFENEINVVMAFDKDKSKCNDENILYIDKMQEIIKKMDIHIGIITVPKEEAQNVCDLMIKNGIEAIWNFAPVNLEVPEGIAIKNEDLSVSLSILIKQMGK